MIRLKQPLEYYERKYGSWTYGLRKLYLLMEKQHNRGQEGAGLACMRIEAEVGEEYMWRERAMGSGAISEIFGKAYAQYNEGAKQNGGKDAPFAGNIYMGHLRYSTTGRRSLQYVHPFLRRNNWRAKNLCLCGNFNLTNVDEIIQDIASKGQQPRAGADT